MVIPVRPLLPLGSSFHGFTVKARLADACRAPLQAFVAVGEQTGHGARVYCTEADDRSRAGRDAFQARLDTLRRIQHERVPRILDGGIDRHLQWVAVDQPKGTPLSEQLAAGEPFDPMQAVMMLRDVIGPLRAARDAGVLHGRLTPWHLLVTGIECRAVLEVGFDGLFRVPNEGHDIVFRAPEQLDLNGEVDERADIYALGAIAYFALGSPPFEDAAGKLDLNRIRARIAQEELPPLSRVRPSCPPELEALARLMCAKRKGDRPRTLEQLDEMLRQALAACVAQRKGRPHSSAAPVVVLGASPPAPGVAAGGATPPGEPGEQAPGETARSRPLDDPPQEKPDHAASHNRPELRIVTFAVTTLACVAILASVGVVGLAWKTETHTLEMAASPPTAPALPATLEAQVRSPVEPPQPSQPSPTPSLCEPKLTPRPPAAVREAIPRPSAEQGSRPMSAVHKRGSSMLLHIKNP